MKRKFLAAFAAAMLAVATFASAAFAEGMTVSASSESAKPGETVEVVVSVSGNTGFTCYDVELQYDTESLRLTDISKGALSGDGLIDVNTAANWVSFATSSSVIDDGVLFTATFEVIAQGEGNYVVTPYVDAMAGEGDIEIVPAVTAGEIAVVIDSDEGDGSGDNQGGSGNEGDDTDDGNTDDGNTGDNNQGGDDGDSSDDTQSGVTDGDESDSATDDDKSDSTAASSKSDAAASSKSNLSQTGDATMVVAAGLGCLALIAAAGVVLARKKGLIG